MAESGSAQSQGYEAGVAAQGTDGPKYTVETLVGPTNGLKAEGVISISPAVLVGAGLARAMQLAGYATHGTAFEHAVSDDDAAQVLVTTEPSYNQPEIPGYPTGHEGIATPADARWLIVVASLRAYLNDEGPLAQ